MEREFSAGGVVVRRMRGRWWLAAVQPAGKEALALPKGLVDAGEKPEAAAAREVGEETGVEAELVGKLGDIKYVYTRAWGGGERVFKIVSFYLFRWRKGTIGRIAPEMRREIAAARWIPLAEAGRLLSYKGEREMAGKALQWARAQEDT